MPETTTRPATVRIARWSATHPWRAIGLWLVFVTACIALGQVAGLRSMSNLGPSIGESGRADRALRSAHLDDPSVENVLFTARHGGFDATQARRAAGDLTARLAALAEVARTATPVPSADGRALLVQVTTAGDADSAPDRVQPLVDATAATQRRFPSLRIEEVGSASLGNAVNAQVNADLGTAAAYSLPVTLVILLVAFGAVVAAGVPVLLALSAVGSAIGLSTIASHLVPDAGTTSSMILLMGMAVGVDYSLFYVKREREERTRGRSRLDAIEIAAQTSGHSVIVSGIAVIVSMCGLFLADDAVFASLATGSILVVAVAVLGSLTVLPALLVKLGRLVDRPRVPLLWRLTSPARAPRFWPVLLSPALRRPGRTLFVAVLGLLALALPALGLNLHSASAATLPRSIPAVQTLDRVSAHFPATQTTQQVVVTAPSRQAAAVSARLHALVDRLADDPTWRVGGIDRPLVRSGLGGRVHEVELSVPFDAQSERARTGLQLLRSRLLPQTVGTVAGARYGVTGETAEDVDYDQHLADRLPWVIGFVLILTLVMMGAIFSSPLIALTTVLVNLLSAGAAFGVLTLTFQHTWAEGLLSFRSTGAVITWIPLFTFAVLFGLSMDYHVFIVSRIRELVMSGTPNREAVRRGITGSAGVVSSAAIVMVSVFAIFAALPMVEMKELGVTLAAAVLIDALIVRAVVLPAAMIVLGRWNWWPAQPPAGPAAMRERERVPASASF